MVRDEKKKNSLKINIIKKDSTFWISMFILVIMVLSVIGFALSSAPSRSSGGSTTGNVPLGQIYQNSETGELYWGARLNGEEFMFTTIEGYDESFIEAGLASKLKAHTGVVIYVDTNFTSNEAVFLVEKALRGIGIESSRVYSPVCDANTLVFTDNISYGEGGSCMKFVVGVDEDAMVKAQKVMYHLIKDYGVN